MSKIVTQSLELRVRALDHADALLQLYRALDTENGMGDRDSVVKSVFLSDTHWRKNGFGYWSIYFSSRLIGNIGLIRQPDGSIGLWVEIHPEFRRKGLAREAVKAVLDFVFQLHKMPSIKLNTTKPDSTIIKFVETLGFKLMGTDKDSQFYVIQNPYS